MRIIKVDVKAKVGNIEKTQTFDYQEPEDFAEAIELDGEKEAFKIFLNERKTRFQDKMRKEMLSNLTKAIQKKLQELGISL